MGSGYFSIKYDSKPRFCSYWHQINEIATLNPKNVLEIGVGNGFVSNYLKKKGFNVITLDKDERLKPDITGNVLEIPFENKTFDVVSCCEVLEHMPFEDFQKALKEISRVTRDYAVISLPETEKQSEKNKYHCWEIGFNSFSLEKIKHNISIAGFKIVKTYNVPENHYHKFFILKNKKEIEGVKDDIA